MEEFKTQGNEFFKKQSYQKAIECYNKGLEIDPNNAILLSNKAAAFIKSGEIKEAIQSAALSTKADPNWAKAWNRLGSALLLDNQFEKSRLSLDKSLSLDPTNQATINLIADLDKRESLLNINKEKVSLNKDEDDDTEEEESEEEVLESIDISKLSSDQIPNMAMPPMPPQMQPMFQQMMQNPQLMAKMSDPSFQQKVLSMQSNPLGAMNDPEMMEVMQMMMGGMNFS